MKKIIAVILLITITMTIAYATEYNDKQTVEAVQEALNKAGFNCGTPDGVTGKKTKAAIEDYQAANGLSITGVIDEKLLIALELLETSQTSNEYDSQYPVGSIIQYGNYNGEAIEWLVIEADKYDRIMISLKGLDAVPFDDERYYGTSKWEEASIRKWLNETFYNDAFNSSEKEQLTLGDLGDLVYLLSDEEATTYFLDDNSRICYATDKAIQDGAKVNPSGACWWWLRSESSKGNVVYVNSKGSLYAMGGNPISKEGCVRPVIRLRLSGESVKPTETTPPTNTSTDKKVSTETSISEEDCYYAGVAYAKIHYPGCNIMMSDTSHDDKYVYVALSLSYNGRYIAIVVVVDGKTGTVVTTKSVSN